jgi:DNA-damage-inducible protein J
MAQINFRIDDETKRAAEALFKSLGLTMSSAITVFLNQSINERGIPFRVHAPDPSARPVSELLQRIDDVEHGRNCHYHDLIEVDGKARKSAPRAKSRPTRSRRRRAVA